MIYFINITLTAFLAFLTVGFMPYFRIFGVVPLLPLFFIIPLTYFRKGAEPFLIASFCGLFLDLNSTTPFGFYLLLFLGVATLVRFLFQEGMRSLSLGYYLWLALGSLFVYYLSHIIILYSHKVGFTMSSALTAIVLGVIVNMVFALIFYFTYDNFFDWELRLHDKLKRR